MVHRQIVVCAKMTENAGQELSWQKEHCFIFTGECCGGRQGSVLDTGKFP